MTSLLRRGWSVVVTAALGLFLLTHWTVLAQGENVFTPSPANDPGMEHLPATPLVFAAYAFVWAALLVYVFLLWQRISRVERDLAEVNAKLSTRKRP